MFLISLSLIPLPLSLIVIALYKGLFSPVILIVPLLSKCSIAFFIILVKASFVQFISQFKLKFKFSITSSIFFNSIHLLNAFWIFGRFYPTFH